MFDDRLELRRADAGGPSYQEIRSIVTFFGYTPTLKCILHVGKGKNVQSKL